MQTYDKLLKTIYGPKRGRLSWVASLAIALIGVAVVAVRADNISVPISKCTTGKPWASPATKAATSASRPTESTASW
jgi:hypothetical protein